VTSTISLEFDVSDTSLDRDQFRDKFRKFRKELTEPLEHWKYQLANVFGEVVKNFYDHADKRGKILVTIDGKHITWEAFDYGPGDPLGRSIDELMAETDRNREKYKNAPSNGNCGLGLGMMQGGLNGIAKCAEVKSSTWSLETKGRFHYQGVIELI
jgi:anti-sigma regulatory factor (Ser/Thr protein kinase)